MGYDDVGKSAKYSGKMHPSHVRRLEPLPERPTPKVIKKPKPVKSYGFEYEGRDFIWKKLPDGTSISDGFTPFHWKEHWQWYETERQRDQAMQAWRHQHSSAHRAQYYGAARPVKR